MVALTDSLNPLIKQLKIQRGIVELISLRDNKHIDFILQYILYDKNDAVYQRNKIVDYNPIILPLTVTDSGVTYPLFKTDKKKISGNGIYGINLNLLLSHDKEYMEEILKIKKRICDLYKMYILKKGIPSERENIINELMLSVVKIYQIKNNNNIFIVNPFIFLKRSSIYFSESINNVHHIDKMKNFLPKFLTFGEKNTKNNK